MRVARSAVLVACLLALGAVGYLAFGRDARPTPVFTRAPGVRTDARTALFAYRVALPRPRFRCALDGGRWRRCGAHRRVTGLTAGAHRFCVRARSGPRRSRTACYAWTVAVGATTPSPGASSSADASPTDVGTASAGAPFTMVATAVAPLLPAGGPVPVDIAFSNPGASPIAITQVALAVAGAEPAGCAAAVRVVRQLAAEPVIPARVTRSLAQLGVPTAAWPQLAMADDGTDQNACRGASIRLVLDGTARG